MYDVFFISYDEPNAEDNWQRLLQFAPTARRVHGVKGIKPAHQQAASMSNTAAFFVVDGDAWISDDWDFYSEFFDDVKLPFRGREVSDCVLVWRSLNPYNGLEYGYGGLKLLPKKRMLMPGGGIDVTTSICDCFMPLDWTACETRFASSSWHAWRGAFRECTKLASAAIINENAGSNDWLEIWTSRATGIYSKEIMKGAIAGKQYGLDNAGNKEAITRINDYDWLKRIHDETL